MKSFLKELHGLVKGASGAGETAQHTRALAVLPEEPVQFPAPMSGGIQSLDSSGTTRTHIHINLFKNNNTWATREENLMSHGPPGMWPFQKAHPVICTSAQHRLV